MGVRVFNKKSKATVTCDAKYWADCSDHGVKAGWVLWTPDLTSANHIPALNGADEQAVSAADYAASSKSVTKSEAAYNSGNTYGGVLKKIPVTLREGGETKDMVVVNMQLGGGAIGLNYDEQAFVSVPKEEVRFMDRDKMTAAFGYALFKDAYTANSPIYLNYTLYGTSGDENIYKIDRLT